MEAEKPVNPLLTLWFRPRRAIRQVVHSYPGQGVILIAAAFGATQAVISIMERPPVAGISENTLLSLTVIFGMIFGLLFIYLGGGLYRWIGSWLGGEADSLDVRTALAWGEFPYFPAFFVWAFSFYGVRFGWPGAEILKPFTPWVSAVFSLWAFVLISQMIAEVHGFAAWRGFLTVIIGLGILLLPVILLLASGIALPALQKGFDPATGKAVSKVSLVDRPIPKPQIKSKIDFTEWVKSGEAVRLKLKGGKTLTARIIEEGETDIFIEVEGRLTNFSKVEIEEAVRAKPA